MLALQMTSEASQCMVSAGYKAMFKIVQVHLEKFVERRQLLAEEQGAFHKGRDAETKW